MNLTQLRKLDLYRVNISSTIPLNFSSYLTTLGLSHTELFGILPERVFHLSNLELLDLLYNHQLTVRFPTTKWNSNASLMDLDLYGVNAAGPIPRPLWNLTSIQILNLRNSHLEGPISQFLKFGKLKSGLQNLQLFSLSSNYLNETIPSWIFSLPSLSLLNLSENNFRGKIPEFKSKSLSYVALKQNQLEGPIPESLLDQQGLSNVFLSQNNLFTG
ncbi:putative receptor-like protein 12-like [Capsicum annuum]|nr:putative receptor-like protein 12-like [Capsicum annuum]KAF3680515.1 putative receptor-like protein 12-like [Capsicum annuum]